MQSFHAEYCKNLGYTFHIQLNSESDIKVLLTPTPDCLFITLNTQVFKISLLSPILSLQQSLCFQTNQWLYIKIPQTQEFDHDLLFKQEPTTSISELCCKKCAKSFAKGFKKTFPMPSTNWETLSELWSCHPSHEQVYFIDKKGKNCYISLFFIHFTAINIENSLLVDDKDLKCPGCGLIVGVSGTEFSVFRHRVLGAGEESLEFLLREAFIERINEINRDLHLGSITIRLLTWDLWVYKAGQFQRAMKVMYCKSATPGIELPAEDLSKIYESLKKANKKLPENCRKFGNWKISFLFGFN